MITSKLKQLVLVSTLSVIAAGSLNASEKEKIVIKWKLAHNPVEYFLRAANAFKEVVEKETNGEIVVDIDSQVATSRDDRHDRTEVVYEELLQNKVQMTQIYTNEVSSRLQIPEFDVFDLPFLFKDDAHVEKALEGKVGKSLLAKLDKTPVKGLGYTYSGGFVVHLTRDKEIKKVADYENLLYRSTMSDLIRQGMDTLGVVSTVQYKNGKKISGDESFEIGKVDVVDAIYSDVIQNFQGNEKGQRAPNVLNDTRHRVLLTALVMNKDFYNKLSPAHKAAVDKAALIAAKKERDNIIEDSERIRSYLQENNIPVITMSASEKEKMKNKMTSVYDVVYKRTPATKEIVKQIASIAK